MNDQHNFFLTPRLSRCYKSIKSEVVYQVVNIRFTRLEALTSAFPGPPPAREQGSVGAARKEYSV
jgi:hypothetical protein